MKLVLIIYVYVMCFWLRLFELNACVCMFDDHPHISRRDHLEGIKTDDGSSAITHSSNSCLVTGVCSSLWPLSPLPPTPFHLHDPSLLRRLRLSLGCFEPPPFFCRAGVLSALWCAACLPCLPPSPLFWQTGGGGKGVWSAYAPLLLPSSLSVQLTLIAWSYCLN